MSQDASVLIRRGHHLSRLLITTLTGFEPIQSSNVGPRSFSRINEIKPSLRNDNTRFLHQTVKAGKLTRQLIGT